ncbi:phage terminase, small subunit, P27 family [Ligilactobacillus salivarius ACS-116-V-Col5a]|uniref:phage terminase small subunit P27 family n=1 Tax=Ligilactobacillus salivarius TaxID=1624 RepID=UPI0001DD2ED5|nr:phage terminase small subunit P27 family [Ligilactobacillus salivarius]EFK79361.1 phage terminase, small subunit, P27 family [Ligilactobacillus salivarius ACS-116-V-Col5a]
MPQVAKSAMMHLYEGNPNNLTKKEIYKRKKNEEKLKVSSNNLNPPSWLEPGAKKNFKRIVELMEPTGILSDVDIDILAVYCDTYYDYLSYKRKIRKTGNLIEGKVNPLIREKRNAASALTKYANMLGLTPSARASLAIHLDEESDDDDDF